MKRTFALLILSVLSIVVARAGDVSVKLTMSTEVGGEATWTFTPDTDRIYALFKTKNAKAGDKIRAALIAEDVGDVAPRNTKVLDKTLDMEGDTEDGEFNFSKPTKGWPVGKYRVDVYVNDDLVTTAKFTVKASAKKKASEEEESGD